jgi:hypothetical protein
MNPRVAASAAAVFLVLIFTAIAGGSGNHATTATTYDRCKISEQDIASLWNATIPQARGEADHIKLVKELAQSAEDICREQRDKKPSPLPSELQKLAH